MQTLTVILFVLACVAYVARALYKTLKTGSGSAGSCCSHGCGGQEKAQAEAATPRVQMITSDSLRANVAARKKTA